MKNLSRFVFNALLVLLLSFVAFAQAQDNPWEQLDQEVVIVAPYPPGGSVDLSSRTLESALQDLGVSARVVNRAGAAGVEGTYWTTEQPSTGYTLVMPGVPALIFQPLVEDVGYTLDDLEPVAMWVRASFGWAVSADAPWETVEDLLNYVQENPGEVSFGSTGARNPNEWLQQRLAEGLDSEIVYVSYGGGGEVIRDLVGGHIDVAFGSIASQLPFVETGELRILAHADPFTEDVEGVPGVPPMRDYVEGLVSYNFFGLLAPAGSPDEVLDAISAAVAAAAEDEEVINTMTDAGLTMSYLDGDAMREVLIEVRDEFATPFLAWVEEQ